MKKITLSLVVVSFLMIAPLASAQGMMGQNWYGGAMMNQYPSSTQETPGQNGSSSQTSSPDDVAKGEAVWTQLQSKKVTCKTLTDDDFDVLGDYFMNQMMGNGHDFMDTMMSQSLGNDGEKQMHIVMGKRYSGCDTTAALPQQYANFQGMMPMMYGNGNYMYGNPEAGGPSHP